MSADNVLGRSKVVIGGIPVDRLDANEWCTQLISDWRAVKTGRGRCKVVTTANGQVVSLFATNPAYRQAVLAADHVAADGMSVVKASRWPNREIIPERVSTTDWFHDAARAAAQEGLKFYMIGATEEANAQAVDRVLKLHPQLQMAGRRNGYFKDEEIPRIAQEVAASGADVLWLAVGNPRQVIIAHQFKALLPQLTWVRTCGGLFDFLAGDRARAPLFLQKAGLEWAWRAALEPRRLLWRYMTTNVHSTFLMAFRSGRAGS